MLKTAPRNGQLSSHSERVSTHYSGHQEYLLPGNGPAAGFSCGLRRMHEKQQRVQGRPHVAHAKPRPQKGVLGFAADFGFAAQ